MRDGRVTLGSDSVRKVSTAEPHLTPRASEQKHLGQPMLCNDVYASCTAGRCAWVPLQDARQGLAVRLSRQKV